MRAMACVTSGLWVAVAAPAFVYDRGMGDRQHDRTTQDRVDLTRSVFRTDGFENIDESWQGGSYIGGMAGAYEDAGIASNYMAAAEWLVERAIANEQVHEVVLPVLFLYRHAIELRLKFAVRPSKPSHDIPALVAALNEMLVAACGSDLAPPVSERIREIATIDPGADAFRFHARKPTKSAPGAAP
jgi:hypothetical protein